MFNLNFLFGATAQKLIEKKTKRLNDTLNYSKNHKK